MEMPIEIVQCLYLEDDSQSQETYKDLIELAWESQQTGSHLKLTIMESTEKAIQELRSNPGKYKLLIADLLFGPKAQEERGLMAIEAARKLDADMGILAFSITESYELAERAKAKGADDFYSKLSMTRKDHSIETFGALLVQILARHQREPVPYTPIDRKSYRGNIPLSAVLETIGPDTVSKLVSKILQRRCTEIIPHFVRAGLSGAFVIRLDSRLEVDDKSPYETRSLLLKVSRDERQISSEISKREDVKTFPSGLFIPFAEAKMVTSGDWHAIAVDYKNAITLEDWLIHSPSIDADTVQRVLKVLFLGSGLRTVYSGCRRRADESPSTFIWKTGLSPSRRARTLEACQQLGSLAETHGPVNRFEGTLIENYVSDARRLDMLDEEKIDLGVSVCTSHGDLHCRNILVDENNNPNLIDPANIDKLHWAADVARLVVDLIVSCWDAGDQSHEWNQMTDWVGLARAVVRDEMGDYMGDTDSPNARVHVALKWLRGNLSTIHSVEDPALKPEWEFRLALAAEFMRAAYRQQDLPSPKRVLGLISACDALHDAAEAYTQPKK